MKKVIYFDEGSATDYLVMQNGGALLMEDVDKDETGDKVEVKVGAKLKMLFNSLFIKGDAEISSNVGLYATGQNLIKTTITNTTLSDFIDAIEHNQKDIVSLKNYKLKVTENSVAYFQTITPYLSMAEGNLALDNNFAIAINKIHDTLELGKGYYELLGIKNGEIDSIFRFNNASFKNNYGITDLLQMDLVYYGIKVGNGTIEQLDFTKMFEENPALETIISMEDIENEQQDKSLPIYDVVLAGVE